MNMIELRQMGATSEKLGPQKTYQKRYLSKDVEEQTSKSIILAMAKSKSFIFGTVRELVSRPSIFSACHFFH